MKKNLFALVLLISFSSFAQAVFVDTLEHGGSLLWVKNLSQNYNLVSVTGENIGTAICTLSVKAGAFIKNSDQRVIDSTYWNVPLKDSSNSIVTELIIPIGGVKSVLVLKPNPYVIKAEITDASNVAVRTIVEGIKQK